MKKKKKRKKGGKKKGRLPIRVPITPDLIRDEGWVPAGWPFDDSSFDCSKDWKHFYGFHGSHGYSRDISTPQGFLRVKRSIRKDGLQRFLITQRFEHDSGRNHELKASLNCALDLLATPGDWELQSVFIDGEGRPIPGVDSITKGSFSNGRISLSTNGFNYSFTSDVMATDWALIDVVQRLPFGMKKPLRFDMLEGLTLLRPHHEIRYRGVEIFKSGGRSLKLHRFDQIGTGTLPYNYWLDENHRLILFVTLSRAYWLDSRGEKA